MSKTVFHDSDWSAHPAYVCVGLAAGAAVGTAAPAAAYRPLLHPICGHYPYLLLLSWLPRNRITADDVTGAFSRRSLPPAYRPFIGPILNARSGRIARLRRSPPKDWNARRSRHSVAGAR